MKKIHRVIYHEITSPVIIALLVLTFVVFTREFGRLAEMLIRKNASATTVFEVIVSILPSILIFTIPIAFLIGTLIGFSRLSSDSEIVAMRANGISIPRLIRPVIKVGLAVTAATLILTLFLLPLGNWNLHQIREDIGLRPVQSQIKPRVFNEDLPGMILYVDDINLRNGSWKGVFLADTRHEGEERIIVSEQGRIAFSPKADRMQLHLENGAIYNLQQSATMKDNVSRFGIQDVQVNLPATAQPQENDRSADSKLIGELLRDISQGAPEEQHLAQIEMQRRIALPLSALIFAVLGVTLGVHAHRGGRGYGFITSMVIAFLYYILFATGSQLAANQVLSVIPGVWGANILLAVFALFSVRYSQVEKGPLSAIVNNRALLWSRKRVRGTSLRIGAGLRLLRGLFSPSLVFFLRVRLHFARVVDLYMMRSLFLYILPALLICVALFYLFTFFELVDDLYSNQISYAILLDYFFYLLPHILVILIPMAVLIGTLITFGVLQRTNQITAFKSCGVSLYRVSIPVLGLTLGIAISAFLLQEYVLPYANQRQDNLRNVIKGQPAQTYYQTGESWIFGEHGRLYNYNYFDYQHDSFADLTIYELDFSENRLKRYISAQKAEWLQASQAWRLSNAIVRDFQNRENGFDTFRSRILVVPEQPPYFEQEVKESSKMTYTELRQYIQELQKGGFEVDNLKTDLYKKLAFPVVSIIMAVLGIPFAFSMGRRGALYGVATGVLIGIFYWGAFGAFEVLGANGLLSPFLAAWGPNIVFGSGAFLMFFMVRT